MENLTSAAKTTIIVVFAIYTLFQFFYSFLSRQAMKKALGIVGLPNVEGCYPAELSIGECRRIELARAMIGSPPGAAAGRADGQPG